MQTTYFTTEQVQEAADVIRRGGLLAIPTETVYGLGANGLNPDAVRRIFEAKGRPQDNPLILHIPDASWLERYCEEVPERAYLLAAAFWPGPLTMILKAKDNVPRVTTGGLDTVGMRCPQHPATRAVIAASDVPVAAPSANTSGRPSCTTVQDCMQDMAGKIEGIMDGGPCTVGVESTIVDLTCDPPQLLRPGGLPVEEIEGVLGVKLVVDKAVTGQLQEGEKPRAPGMAYRHYAPQAPVTVIWGRPEDTAVYIRCHSGTTTGVICFDEYRSDFPDREVQSLGPQADLAEHARRVFDALRHYDETEVTEILTQCPPPTGLGLAVGNRLKKAAGFRVIEVPQGPRMKLIGITGPTGAGKTTALNELTALGAVLIDCDAVYHQLLAESQDLNGALRARFPAAYVGATLDRKALGNIVFRDERALADLNDITGRFINAEVDRRIAQAQAEGRPGVGIDAINLLTSDLKEKCDVTVGIVAPDEVRVKRIMARDGISEEYARSRIAAQPSNCYFEAECTHTLHNDGTQADFARQAHQLFQALLSEAAPD